MPKLTIFIDFDGVFHPLGACDGTRGFSDEAVQAQLYREVHAARLALE